MFAAVYGMVVIVAVLCFSHRGLTADSTGESRMYNQSNHYLIQNQEQVGFTILQVGKEEVAPYFRSPQYSCLRNGSNLCPPWSYCDSTDGACKCPQIPFDVLECDGFENRNALRVLDCNCVTYDEELNQTEVGLCIYTCVNHKTRFIDEVYHLLPPNTSDWNDFTCGKFNRTGSLCGKCNMEDGFYPRAYSFDVTCIQCTNGKSNWWKYVLSAYLPLTLFYLVILFFKINIHSSQLHGYIIYSQIISLPAFSQHLYRATQGKPLVFHVVKVLASLYGIWNLDFFRMYNPGICLQTDTLATLALDLGVAVYPLLLMAVTYMMISLYDYNFKLLVILWKPFRDFFSLFQRNLDIRTSIVDAFATFLFLTNVKFLSVCFYLLVPVKVYHFVVPEHHVNYTWRLYHDATVPYFGAAHLPYAILAIVVMFFFVLTPTLIIIAYPIKVCHKCFNLLPRRGQLFLHTFMDSFQGCYKDGTELGTRDCRWFSSMIFILRFVLMSIYAYSLNTLYFLYAAVVLVITAMITIAADPFKAHLSHHLSTMVIFILFIAGLYVSASGLNIAEITNNLVMIYILNCLVVLVGVLPVLYIFILILHWLFSHWKFGLGLIRRANSWTKGYKELM